MATLEENEFAPSLELKINFISPGLPGIFQGKGTIVSRGGKVCILEGDLWQNGKHVARSSATSLITRR